MDDPDVRTWLGEREQARAPAPATKQSSGISADMTAPAMAVRQHILASLGAIPTALPELARAWRVLYAEIAERGVLSTLMLVAMFLGLGILVERLYWRATTGFRQRLIAMQLDTVEARLKAVGLRLAFGLGWIGSFALGSLGAFLLFDWPPLLHGLIARVLLVVIVVWLTSVLLRFILAPGAERFRILPVSTASAAHWHRWLTVVVGWYTAARLTDWFLADLGLSEAVQGLVADVFSLIWLLILMLALWRRPALKPDENPDAALALRRGPATLLISAALVCSGCWCRSAPTCCSAPHWCARPCPLSWSSPIAPWRMSCGRRARTLPRSCRPWPRSFWNAGCAPSGSSARRSCSPGSGRSTSTRWPGTPRSRVCCGARSMPW